MKHTEETGDLLSLIGRSIDELRLSIGLFEAADRESGLDHLTTVVASIDAYLGRLELDPLLRLAPIPPSEVRAGLNHIRGDLDEVIRGLSRPAA
ncbi:MAG: hypothetical protein NTV92_07675 [Candidatus Bipolaricaulota bacterium]|nr:hypothetical protein [Candidatus Bipolaricaulota bacterium]